MARGVSGFCNFLTDYWDHFSYSKMLDSQQKGPTYRLLSSFFGEPFAGSDDDCLLPASYFMSRQAGASSRVAKAILAQAVENTRRMQLDLPLVQPAAGSSWVDFHFK